MVRKSDTERERERVHLALVLTLIADDSNGWPIVSRLILPAQLLIIEHLYNANIVL